MTTLQPIAQPGIDSGIVKLAHDPGDPLITSHCPFCGSGQVIGRSDGTIECEFCGQNYIVRVQPAFPGSPQMPGEGGAPSDIGPDGGVLPPDALGPDGLPMGGGPMPPDDPEMDEDGSAPPFGDDEEGDGGEDADGPPGEEADDSGGPPASVSPPPKSKGDTKGDGGKKDKPKKKGSLRTYTGLGGQVLTEDQYVRHLAITLSGSHPHVLAQLRAEAASQ